MPFGVAEELAVHSKRGSTFVMVYAGNVAHYKQQMHTVRLSVDRVTRILSYVTIVLVVLSIVTTFATGLYLGGTAERVRNSLYRLFNVDGESNIPEWYSSCLLLVCSILLSIITSARRGTNDRWRWALLSVAFLFLSMDEAAQLHEMSVKPLREMFHLTGFFYFGWVIPASVLVLIFGAVYWPFLMALPRHTRFMFTISGAMYVGGAIAVESISAFYASTVGNQSVQYRLLNTLEETMEMFGLVIFLRGVLQYMSAYLEGPVTIVLDAGPRPASEFLDARRPLHHTTTAGDRR